MRIHTIHIQQKKTSHPARGCYREGPLVRTYAMHWVKRQKNLTLMIIDYPK